MKKVLFPILALVLALGLALPAAAHTEGDPAEYTLYAGQDIDVGTVSVWNDGDSLYVEYQTTGDWVMTETHLAVVDDEGDFPTTKTGNPKVGHFAYSMEHDPPVAEYTYIINLGDWDAGTELFIAAHAVVQKLSDPITASFATGDGIDTVLFITEDPANPNYPLGYPEAYGNTATPSVVIQGTPAGYSGWPTITGAQWISDSLANPGSANSWRLFTRGFNIPSNAINISGTLHIDSDNAEEAKINDSPAAGLVYGTVYGAVIGQPQEWKRIQHWPVSSYLQPGPNMLEVMVRNYYWVPTPGMWNYTGLIYKMDYEYQLLFTETAWGDGTRFTERGNWATYFTYHVQGWHLVETLTVAANSMVGVDSSVLEPGKTYMFKATGTWQDMSQTNHYIDAEYTTFDSWATYMDGTANWGPDQKDLQVDGQFVDWGSYSSDHEYTLMFAGGDSTVNFRIFDGRANASPPIIESAWYTDNQGSLMVDIYKWD